MLLGIESAAKNRFKDTLLKKRKEYMTLARSVARFDEINMAAATKALRRQIEVDLPRTNCYGLEELKIFISSKRIQKLGRRVLFVWSIRHPACGYVQGINDLITPLLVVFAQE